MDPEKTLKEMNLEEKVLLVVGTKFMYTNALPRLSVPSLRFSDGPHGLRVQSSPEKLRNGVSGDLPATAFPTAAAVASGWDPENARRIGDAMAREARFYGINIVLGPGANIKRNPRCGRNFEYYSEDPLLSGKMAAAEIRGLENAGVGACLKHFAMNNAENFRFIGDSIVDMRAAREIYLKSFEIAVKEGAPRSVMSAYNKVNGRFCAENSWLLRDVLRKDWGFEGIVMTDWGGISDKVASIKAGDELDMPGDTVICRRHLYDAVKDGVLDEAVLDEAVLGILKTIDSFRDVPKEKDPGFEEHHKLAADVAADCAVLLKNNGSLPLSENEKVLVIGDLFRNMRYQGSGSSMITPAFLTTPEDAFRTRGAAYDFAPGYVETEEAPDEKLIAEALAKAENYDSAVVFTGLTDYDEGEAGDREHLLLPDNQLALIDALVRAGKKIVLVLFGGSPVELPFANSIDSILLMTLPGQNGGEAVYRLLYGEVSPSGRLAETWPVVYSDVPYAHDYSVTGVEVYKESIFVGYRYYSTFGKATLFPFGHGLSYTRFKYDDLVLSEKEGNINVSCSVTNVGSIGGKEVVQIYVGGPASDVFKPEKELKAFKKVFIKSGETVRVTFDIPLDDLRYYNIREERFVLEDGEYRVLVCRDAENVILSGTLRIPGESIPSPYSEKAVSMYGGGDLEHMSDELYEELFGMKLPEKKPPLPLTIESRISDFKHTACGRFILRCAMIYVGGEMKKARRTKDPAKKSQKLKAAIFARKIMETNSMRSLSMASSGRLPLNVAEGIVFIANGHILKGLGSIMKKIKDPSKKVIKKI
ncbi:MAG: glycoside hydrolase family 3 C-terminal domain-containing protein [Clostridia bacterium]|nr:glycoside hydrolase family 3 C-terminal domain-containing protein [Clostridia bacterium]